MNKALISESTYRTLDMQRAAFADLPCFVLPDDLPQVMRPTTRQSRDRFHVASLGIIADKEAAFHDFLPFAKERRAEIVSREDNQIFIVNGNIKNLLKWWKDGRRKNVSKIGGDLGAKARRGAIAERAKYMTRAEWTDGSINNAQLVDKYNASINALKRYVSDKGWGHYRQKAICRAEAARPRKARSP